MKTLVVDDNRHAREGLCLLLAMGAGLKEVFQASGGEEAVRLARQLQPELILMDVQMLGVDGLEAIRRIRSLDPKVRIVAMSMDPSKQEAALEAGADAFADKVDLGHRLASMAGKGGAADFGLLPGGDPPPTDPKDHGTT